MKIGDKVSMGLADLIMLAIRLEEEEICENRENCPDYLPCKYCKTFFEHTHMEEAIRTGMTALAADIMLHKGLIKAADWNDVLHD